MSTEKLKKIVIPDKDKNEHLQMFNMFDTNGDGHISITEFQNLLNKFGINRKREEIVEMMHTIDKDGNNSIEYEEILDFLKQSESYKEENEDAICDAFNIIDKEGKGFLTQNDLLFFIRKIGLNIPYNVIIEEFQVEDADNNDKLSFSEFRYMIKRDQPITNFKMIADLLVFIDKIELKTSMNSIYPQSEEVHDISMFLKKFYIFEKLPRGRLYTICKNVVKKNSNS